MNQTFRFKSVKRVLFVELREFKCIESFKQRHSQRKQKRPRLVKWRKRKSAYIHVDFFKIFVHDCHVSYSSILLFFLYSLNKFSLYTRVATIQNREHKK